MGLYNGWLAKNRLAVVAKLVYVLTCAPEKHYIEQALIAVFSARYWNPDIHIVLVVDDLTNQLLNGKRAQILDYVSEKIIVPFEEISRSPMYRSRWIKTSVRQMVEGDFLFVDCDTIVCKSLADIDTFDCKVGAVWESHLPVEEYCDGLRKKALASNARIGVDLDEEKEYFSSGVLWVKDVPDAYRLYELWHQYWLESEALGLPIDQPALAKANRECGYLIRRIPDTYNCILFTRNDFVEKAHILHIAAYRNPSFLFNDKVFKEIKEKGLLEWIERAILYPQGTMLPFDYAVCHSTLGKRLKWIGTISHTACVLRRNLPVLLENFPMQSSFRKIVLWLFNHRCYLVGATIWMLWKRTQVLGKKDLKDNICKK
jgi:hypothetical protein